MHLWSAFDYSDSSIICKISGEHIQNKFSLESGIHRVQRVPPTETKGRRHTSTIAVAVLPFVSFNPKYKESDFKIEYALGSGPGGQHRNKTMTTVKITHVNTGITATMDGRSQYQNKKDAMSIILSRLKNRDNESHNTNTNQNRIDQIGNMGRGSRVRTYNFIEDRVKDERIKKKFRTKDIMDGNLTLIYNTI